jgi:hypothetical protein
MNAQPFPPFTGGFYRTRWPVAASDQAINIYSETREYPGSPKNEWIYGTPGLKFLATINGPNRGWFTQDGRTFTVGGTTLYEYIGGVFTAITGTIPNDGFPVVFASNGLAGDQLAIAGGGQIAVYDLVLGGALTIASLPFSNPVMIAFQDGYGLVNEKDTPTVWFSALEDFTSWDALDFFTRSETSDNCVGIAVTRDRLMFIGSKTTNLFYDSGNADNPWLPYPGTTTQVGCVAWPTISVYSDVVRFIAISAKGEPKIVQMRADMNLQIISTPPIDDVLVDCTTLADAEQLTYEQAGHPFIVWTLPSSNEYVKSYHYDVKESSLKQAPVWGARAGVNESTGDYIRWRARGSTATNNVVYAGDYISGDVYTLDLETYKDNGVTLRRERVVPYLSNGNQWLFVDGVELVTQAGATSDSTGQGSDPQANLLFSGDGTNTWVDRGPAPLGVKGDYTARTMWTRCGRYREDRIVLRIIQTDPAPCVWTELMLSIRPGTKRLV